jgi:biotin carboxyl carrier protein
MTMEYTLSAGNRKMGLSIREIPGGLEVALDGRAVAVDMVRIGSSQCYSLLINGRSYEVQVQRDGENYEVVLGQQRYGVTVESDRARMLKSLISSEEIQEQAQEIKAAMPGLVVKVEVKEGDRVRSGGGLVVVEAMKMENELRAPRQGVVKQIFVKKGMTVDQGQTLLVIE